MSDPKMTKVTIKSGYNLDDYYYDTLQYFREEYHTYHGSGGKPVGAAERGRINHFDAMARGCAGDIPEGANLGKDVF